MIALRALLGALGGKGYGSGEIDREAGRASLEACDVESSGTHRFDLG